MNAKIAKYGNSLTVRLPAAIARELDLRDGDEVNLRRIKDGIALERPARSRLEARLATVREREAEVSAGRAVGRELE
jgi:antitoxin MazE